MDTQARTTGNDLANKVIDNLGGTDKTAAIVGLKKAAISQWRKRGIPKGWEKFLRKAKPRAFL
jgi:hypothetical protein